jgi:hypothetical protein
MAALYVLLQVIAVVLMAANCWLPALIVAGVALGIAAWGGVKWLVRSARPIKAPRPYSV